MAASDTAENSHRHGDRVLALALFAFTAAIFGPLTLWFARATIQSEQLLHGLVVLALGAAMLFMERRERLRLSLEFGRRSQALLMASYAFLLAFYLSGLGWLIILAYLSAIAATAIFLFGERLTRVALALTAAFGVFLGLAALLSELDWPLRTLAGQNAGWLLGLLGKEVSLAVVGTRAEPVLLMRVDGTPFNVAAECNGFGLLTASLMLATLLTLYRRVPWLDKGLLILQAVLIGFVFNLLRIVIIVLLAPVVGRENYLLMHEAVGITLFYGALILLWWMVFGFREKKPVAA